MNINTTTTAIAAFAAGFCIVFAGCDKNRTPSPQYKRYSDIPVEPGVYGLETRPGVYISVDRNGNVSIAARQ